ncbi:MAG: hypothetical protein IJ038_07490 [Clostridia bacterium]|nr:hypothetical protein [Clostridia bacterium]
MKKTADKIMIAICMIFLCFFGIWIFAKPQSAFSAEENRVLSTFPRLSAYGVANGEFFEDIGNFFCDQFPMRSSFTAMKAKSELLLGRYENNGVIFGKGDYLMIRPRYENLNIFNSNIESVKSFCEKYTSEDTETAVFFAPRAVDVLVNYLPNGYSDTGSNVVWSIVNEKLPQAINANEDIRSCAGAGEYVWYKTDHHWTSLGAYECYEKVISCFGDVPISREILTKELVNDEFFGTVVSKSGLSDAAADEIFLLRYDNDEEYAVVNYDTGEIGNLFYFFEYLDVKDKYRVFLGGNCGRMGIYGKSSGEERETLMIIKDSFANSAAPFFAYNYDIEMYDLRYFDGRISEEISRIQPDKILILYGIDTAASDASLGLLGR